MLELIKKNKEVIYSICSQCRVLDRLLSHFLLMTVLHDSLVFIFQKEQWAFDSQSSLSKVKLVSFQIIPALYPWLLLAPSLPSKVLKYLHQALWLFYFGSTLTFETLFIYLFIYYWCIVKWGAIAFSDSWFTVMCYFLV